jgi:hypothetical protein
MNKSYKKPLRGSYLDFARCCAELLKGTDKRNALAVFRRIEKERTEYWKKYEQKV